ncbi:MAG: TatD family nuclease-associated radical SAM protein [Candidatus Bathyarchaeota archaeon]|jgi:TatD family-associated radical SAM protein|nr:TatD family nuclease-associated radical SAM protein [Candidatus Bathyarchaeota archaeon]
MPISKIPRTVYWLGNKLYLNITNRCSNSCYFCIRNFKESVGGFNLKLTREPSTSEIIKKLQDIINLRSWSEIVFCGFGEPLERLDCLIEVCKWIKRYYGKPVRIRIDTNGQGYLINKGREVVEELKEAGVDKISVSLNAHEKKIYNEICKPAYENAFESVLEFIEKAGENFETEITAVAIPEVDISKVGEIAKKLGVRFRVREYIPCFW